MMMGSASSYSSAHTTLFFSVTSNGTTAHCDLSFVTDFTCISKAQVSCTLISQDDSDIDMGKMDYSGDFINKIDGTAYNIEAILSFYPSSNTISSLILCMFPTCSPSSSSIQQDFCLDYSAGCGSSSSSSIRSSSSPSHSTFKYISSSYPSFYSSSSSSSFSSSIKSTEGEGLVLIFGSSPSSSKWSVAGFGWSSGSDGVVFAWPSFESSSETAGATTSSLTSSSSSSIATIEINTTTLTTDGTTATTAGTTAGTTDGTTTVFTTAETTTGFTTTGGVTNSMGSLV